MTRKEFVENLIRDLGFEVTGYRGHVDRGQTTKVTVLEAYPAIYDIRVYVDVYRNGTVSIKFKSPAFNAPVDSYSARAWIREANAWLLERGFEAIADWYYSKVDETGYLRIRSKGLPWEQCAKHMTTEEAIKDACTEQKRFRDGGNVLEEPKSIAIAR